MSGQGVVDGDPVFGIASTRVKAHRDIRVMAQLCQGINHLTGCKTRVPKVITNEPVKHEFAIHQDGHWSLLFFRCALRR